MERSWPSKSLSVEYGKLPEITLKRCKQNNLHSLSYFYISGNFLNAPRIPLSPIENLNRMALKRATCHLTHAHLCILTGTQLIVYAEMLQTMVELQMTKLGRGLGNSVCFAVQIDGSMDQQQLDAKFIAARSVP